MKLRCDATADVDDVLIPLGLTGLTYIGIENFRCTESPKVE
jgi:hypothetical protein